MHFGFIFFGRDLIRGVASTARLAEAHGYDLLGIDDSPALAHDAFLVFAIAGISSALLAHGFLRVRCNDCAHEKLVVFSCTATGVLLLVRCKAHGRDGGVPGPSRHPAVAGQASTCMTKRRGTAASSACSTSTSSGRYRSPDWEACRVNRFPARRQVINLLLTDTPRRSDGGTGRSPAVLARTDRTALSRNGTWSCHDNVAASDGLL